MFKKKRITSLQLTEIPSGLFIRTEAGVFYVHSNNKRYRCITNRVVESWSPQRVIPISEQSPAVQSLKIVAKLKFRNGTLLYSQYNGKMYLVSDSKIRQINNPDILEQLNMKRSEAIWVSKKEIELHQEGEPLD